MTFPKNFFPRISALALAVFAIHLPIHAKEAALDPTKEMASQTRWVVNTINARHYLRESMEKLDGKEMVEAYAKSFDHGKMYFSREDIDDFVFRFGPAMEKFLEKGNLYAAFEIFDTFKEEVEARTQWVHERLKGDFDFTTNKTFSPDRRKAEWPATKKDRDDLWERRIKYELLNELLSLAAESTGDVAVLANPDLIDGREEEFDPAKIQRLLEEPEFFAETLDAAREKIRRRYERNLTFTSAREPAEVQESFINSMTQLFDPHSSFLSADTLASFNSAVQNSFVGIGALLQDEDGICTIKEILPGGPAEASRLLSPEDQILGVAQGEDGEFEDVVDMQLRYIVRKIKGEEGTIVRLLIRPGGASDPSVRRDISIVRGEVKLTANLASGKLIEVPNADGRNVPVGVIELPSFYGNIGGGGSLTTTSDDVAELIEKLRTAGAEGLILDLRMNGGGLLSEAVRVAGLFIPSGPVVQVRDNNGRMDILSDRDPSIKWDGPLIVLTSRFSASASEIVAGALRDHNRALIVGNSSTHGKGTVQEVYHMNNQPVFSWFQAATPPPRPVASKITIKQFYLPGGSSTQVKGVPSDIVLPSVNEFLPIGEDDLPHALPWNEMPAVELHSNWKLRNIQSPEDPELRTWLTSASESRQQTLEEFAFLKKQIEWRQRRIEEKEISLNLKDRIQKNIEDQAFLKELDATYDALSENAYASKPFLVKVAEEQEEISRKNLLKELKKVTETIAEGIASVAGQSTEGETEADGEASSAAVTEDDAGEDTPPFDIYLRESARIMADWVRFGSDQKTAKVEDRSQVESLKTAEAL